MQVKARDLIPGQAYRIILDDCCIDGVIERAIFVRKSLYDDGSGDMEEYFVLHFEGLKLEGWHGCKFEPGS